MVLTMVSVTKRLAAFRFLQLILLALVAWGGFDAGVATAAEEHEHIQLRTGLLPISGDTNPVAQADRQVIGLFKAKYPWIEPVATTGLNLPGGRTMDMIPFMQIAGDMAPDLMYVNFRQSDTYISMKLLYPLDQYVEAEAQVHPADSSSLSNDQYRRMLEKGAGWPTLAGRLAEQTWDVMRRKCPYGETCPYREKWGQTPLSDHRHIFIFPVQPIIIVMVYDKGLTAKYDS